MDRFVQQKFSIEPLLVRMVMSVKSSFSLLNTDYVLLDRSWNYKNVVSSFYRLYLINKGSGYMSAPGEKMLLEENYLYLIPSYTLVNQVCDNLLGQYYVHFAEESANGSSLFSANRKLFKLKATQTDISLFERLIAINPGRDLRKSDDPEVYEKTELIRESIERNNYLPQNIILETEGIIMLLLSRFIGSDQYEVASIENVFSKIPEAMNYIDTNLDKKLSVDLLAARANLSTDYFSKLFHEHTGERPLFYIQRKRVERAQFLMFTTASPLSIIAERTGFEDTSYFSRVFKKYTGYTPASYQRMDDHPGKLQRGKSPNC